MAVLASLITAISAAVLADLGRTVLPRIVTDTRGGNRTSLPLAQWPVTAVLSVTVGRHRARRRADAGRRRLVARSARRDATGHHAAAALHRGVLSARTRQRRRHLSRRLRGARRGGAGAGRRALRGGGAGRRSAPGASTPACRVLRGRTPWLGVSTPSPTASAGAAIALSYGYVPADLARACLEWVADRYVSRSRIGVSAKTLGGQETASFVVKAMPDVVSRLLQPYRRVGR